MQEKEKQLRAGQNRQRHRQRHRPRGGTAAGERTVRDAEEMTRSGIAVGSCESEVGSRPPGDLMDQSVARHLSAAIGTNNFLERSGQMMLIV